MHAGDGCDIAFDGRGLLALGYAVFDERADRLGIRRQMSDPADVVR